MPNAFDQFDSAPASTTPPTNPFDQFDATQSSAAPKLPDPSGIQQTVKDNLAAQQQPENDNQQLQTPAQKLDTGLGFPATQMLKGGAQDTPLPANIREHITTAYKNGTATDAGDYMQSVLPVVANTMLNPGTAVGGIVGRYLATSPEIGAFARGAEQSVVPSAAGFAAFAPGAVAGGELAAVPAVASGPFAPFVEGAGALVGGLLTSMGGSYATAEGQKKFLESYPQIADKLGLSNEQLLKDAQEHSTASFAGQLAPNLAFMRPGFSSVGQVALGGALGAGQEAGREYAGNKKLDPEKIALSTIMTAITNKETALGAGISSHVLGSMGGVFAEHAAGHEALKPLVADQVGKPPEVVTPDDINHTIAQGFTNVAPAAQHFEDTAKVMFGVNGQASGVDLLHQIYNETGVKPDQVFEDARNNPEVARSLMENKVPIIYDSLRDQPPTSSEQKPPATITVDHSLHASEEFRNFAQGYEPTLEGLQNATYDYVRQKQAETGKEHMLAIDKNKKVISSASGTTDRVGIPPEALHVMNVPNSNVELVHSHPISVGVGPLDIRVMVRDGVKSNVAVLPDGHTARVSFTPETKNSMKGMILEDRQKAMDDILTATWEAAADAFKTSVPDVSKFKVGEGIVQYRQVHNYIFNKALERAGLTNYEYSNNHFNIIPEDVTEKAINDTVNIIKEGMSIYGIQGATKSPESVGVSVNRGRGEERNGDILSRPSSSTPGGDGGGRQQGPPDGGGVIPEPEKSSNRSTEGKSKANPLSQILNPAGVSESARDMATALRQAKGPIAQETARIQSSMEEHAPEFNKMSDDERLQLIDYMENRSSGAEIHDPKLQEVADQIRSIYEQMGQKVKEAFPDVGLRQDYFTHQYEDEAAAKKFFSDFIAKQGSERNLQEREFPTLAEAMRAGLKPKTTNPIETVMNYVINMNNLITAQRGVELARESGVADYFKKGQQPDGWVPLNGNLAEREGKVLYAPEDAARVYNNDISQKATGPIGNIVDNIQRANNFASKLVLGISGYHFTATTMASMSSDVGRAVFGGSIPERLGDLGNAAVSPVLNARQGGKLIEAYLGRSDLSPELQQALDLAVKNNTINIRQQDYWKAGPAKDYVDAFRNGTISREVKEAGQAIKEKPITGTAKVIANELGRTMDTISKPLFDYYIPRIKISANIAELHDWLQSHPDASPEEQDRAAQDIGNSIDNRFGEMMRDNLFWHQLTRQTLQTTLLSYSWVAGGARMLKGIPDAGLAIIGKKELSANARYLFGAAATYAVINGVRTYIGTGKAPDDWKDFIYPRTGGVTPQSKPERELLPGHIGQFTNYLHNGLGELGNELSPGLKLTYHLLSNSDFRGLPITNANNSWFSKDLWGDYLKYAVGEETPIGLKNFLQGEKKGSRISEIEQALGARPASQFITDPEGYEKMMKGINEKAYAKKLHSDKKMKAQYDKSEED